MTFDVGIILVVVGVAATVIALHLILEKGRRPEPKAIAQQAPSAKQSPFPYTWKTGSSAIALLLLAFSPIWIAWMLRYEVSAGEQSSYVLDRWSGTIIYCERTRCIDVRGR